MQAHLRDQWGEKYHAPEDDDVILNESPITVSHHHHASPGSGTGQFAKALIGAGLLATGLGVPWGAWQIADALKQPAEVRTTIEKQFERWDSTVEMEVQQ